MLEKSVVKMIEGEHSVLILVLRKDGRFEASITNDKGGKEHYGPGSNIDDAIEALTELKRLAEESREDVAPEIEPEAATEPAPAKKAKAKKAKANK